MTAESTPTPDPAGSDTVIRPRIHGVLVTFDRPEVLDATLAALSRQTRRLDRLLVVDNAPGPASEHVVRKHESSAADEVLYLPSETNLGSVGGFGRGMEHAVADAAPEDWVLSIDDDDPPPTDTLLEELAEFGAHQLAVDPRLGACGLVGSVFDWRRAMSIRVPDDKLHGAVPVDWLGQNHFAMYRVRAVRETGPYSQQLFFGHGELEYGLRMRKAGFQLYAHGDLWRSRRKAQDRLGLRIGPERTLGPATMRRYYRHRNLIWILRSHGHHLTAARVALVRGLGKPLAGALRHPALAARHLRLNLRATIDGWRGNLGPRAQPEMRRGAKPPPPGRAELRSRGRG